MEYEEVDVSHVDSPPPPDPVSAPRSPRAAPAQTEVLSTSNNTPVANLVKLQLATREAQGILYGVPSSNQDEDDGTPSLALPQALVPRQSWVSQDTNLRIRKTCGEAGNRICRQCRRKFSSARWLRVHTPQHFINVFCPCGEYSYQRDYVLRHQRISRCYTGHVFAVDQATFPEFRDLILPHMGDPHKRATLSQGFPPCRTIQKEDEEPTAASQPAATQPLRVVLARVGAGARTDTSALGPRPSTADRRRPERSSSRSRPQLEDEVRHLRRRLARCEADLTQLQRRINQLERHRPVHKDGTYRE